MPIEVTTAVAMQALGAGIAKLLVAGDVVILDGPLGAGKTTFAQGLAQELGVQGAVTSPTFVMARIHKSIGAGVSLVHVDAYRLAETSELSDLDLDATTNAVFLIEWGLPYAKNFTDSWLEVRIARSALAADANDAASGLRTVEVIAVGDRWANLDLSGIAL